MSRRRRVGSALYEGRPLNARELQVLERIAEGDTNRDIGRVLMLSEETIKTYVKRIAWKLDAASRTHAVAIGFRTGLLH